MTKIDHLTHWQLVDAVMEFLQKYFPFYERMTFDERRLEAKRLLDVWAMQVCSPPIPKLDDFTLQAR